MEKEEFEAKKFLLSKYHSKAKLEDLKMSLAEIERLNAKRQLRDPAKVEFLTINDGSYGASIFNKIIISDDFDLSNHYDYISAYTTLQHESWHCFQFNISSINEHIVSKKFAKEIGLIRIFQAWEPYLDFEIPVNLFTDGINLKHYLSYYFAHAEKQAWDIELISLKEDYAELLKTEQPDPVIEKAIEFLTEQQALHKAEKEYFFGDEPFLQDLKDRAASDLANELIKTNHLPNKEAVFEELKKIIADGEINFGKQNGTAPLRVSDRFAKNAEKIYFDTLEK